MAAANASGQQDFDDFMDTLIEENPDVPFCEGAAYILRRTFDRRTALACSSLAKQLQFRSLSLVLTECMCSGDLDLISELLPDLTGMDGLSAEAQGSSSSGYSLNSLQQVDTIRRPLQGPQAEPDCLGAEHELAMPYREYNYDWHGNIYGGTTPAKLQEVHFQPFI